MTLVEANNSEGIFRLSDPRTTYAADSDQIFRHSLTYNSPAPASRAHRVERARLGSGERLNLEPHAIEEIVDAARGDCKTLGARLVQVQVPPGLPAAGADLSLAKKALAQLLENASKYSPPEEPITVRFEMRGDFVVTSVVDRGVGIDAHEQDLIFDKFYRGKDHRHVFQGTGMGLPIAKAIVEAHGGSFTLPVDPQIMFSRDKVS
jgi:two-component system sensor histidine kinase KdpD